MPPEEKGDIEGAKAADILDGTEDFLMDPKAEAKPPEDNDDPPEKKDPPPEKKPEAKKDEPPPEKKEDDIVIPDDLEIDGLKGDEGDEPPVEEPTDEEKKDAEEADKLKLDESGKTAFITMRRENREQAKKIAELIEATKKPPVDGDPEALKAIQEELKKAHDTIGMLSLEKHPAFIAKYDSPKQLLIDQAKGVLKQYELDESIADQAVGKDIKSRIDFLTQNAPDLVSALSPLFTQIDLLENGRKSELANHEQIAATMREQQKKQSDAQVAQVQAAAFETALKDIREDKSFVFMESKSNTKHNENVSKLLAQAQKVLASDDPNLQTKMLIKGVGSDIYEKLFMAERSKRQQLEKDLAIHSKTKPRISSRGSDDKTTKKPSESKEGMSLDDMANAVAGGIESKKANV